MPLRQRYVGGMPNILFAPTLPTTPLAIPESKYGRGAGTGTKKEKAETTDKTKMLYADTRDQMAQEQAINGESNIVNNLLSKIVEESNGDLNAIQSHPMWNNFQSMSKDVNASQAELEAIKDDKVFAYEEHNRLVTDLNTKGIGDDLYHDGDTKYIMKGKSIIATENNGTITSVDTDKNGKPITLTQDLLPKGSHFATKMDWLTYHDLNVTHPEQGPVTAGIIYTPGKLREDINAVFLAPTGAHTGGWTHEGIQGSTQVGDAFYNLMVSNKAGESNQAQLAVAAKQMYGDLSVGGKEELYQKYLKDPTGYDESSGKIVPVSSFEDYYGRMFQNEARMRRDQAPGGSTYTSLGESKSSSGKGGVGDGMGQLDAWETGQIQDNIDLGYNSLLNMAKTIGGKEKSYEDITVGDIKKSITAQLKTFSGPTEAKQFSAYSAKILTAMEGGYKIVQMPNGGLYLSKYTKSNSPGSAGFPSSSFTPEYNNKLISKAIANKTMMALPDMATDVSGNIIPTDYPRTGQWITKPAMEEIGIQDVSLLTGTDALTTLGGHPLPKISGDLIFVPRVLVSGTPNFTKAVGGSFQEKKVISGYTYVTGDEFLEMKGWKKSTTGGREEYDLGTHVGGVYPFRHTSTSNEADNTKTISDVSYNDDQIKAMELEGNKTEVAAYLAAKGRLTSSTHIYRVPIEADYTPFKSLILTNPRRDVIPQKYTTTTGYNKQTGMAPVTTGPTGTTGVTGN